MVYLKSPREISRVEHTYDKCVSKESIPCDFVLNIKRLNLILLLRLVLKTTLFSGVACGIIRFLCKYANIPSDSPCSYFPFLHLRWQSILIYEIICPYILKFTASFAVMLYIASRRHQSVFNLKHHSFIISAEYEVTAVLTFAPITNTNQ